MPCGRFVLLTDLVQLVLPADEFYAVIFSTHIFAAG